MEHAIIKERKKLILPVGHHRQITSWSCGPSALKIVLDYYKDRKNIRKIIKESECSPEYPYEGTLLDGIKKALKKFKYRFIIKENSRLKEIKRFIDKKIPVIVAYQAYHGGHFAVIIGYDKTRFLFSDPAYDKKYKWISKKDFLKRWWGDDLPGEIVRKLIIVIFRK